MMRALFLLGLGLMAIYGPLLGIFLAVAWHYEEAWMQRRHRLLLPVRFPAQQRP
jgi:hypothetical protein